MDTKLAALITVSVTMGALLWSEPAEACSRACIPGKTTPGDGALVPANRRGISWNSNQAGQIEKEDIQFEHRKDSDSAWKPVDFTIPGTTKPNFLLVEPVDGFETGTEYRLVGPECADRRVDIQFETTSPAPLPEHVGELDVTETRTGDLKVAAGGSCSRQITAAQARVEVQLDEEARAWGDVIEYRTSVDGETWSPTEVVGDVHAPGTSWKGRGMDLLYAACDADELVSSPNLEPGRHNVYMEAFIRADGQSKVYRTNEVEVVLNCGKTEPVDRPDTGVPMDAGDRDTGEDSDSSSRPDSGAGDGSASDLNWREPSSSGGCSCSTEAPSSGRGALAVILVTLWFGVRYRRERRS